MALNYNLKHKTGVILLGPLAKPYSLLPRGVICLKGVWEKAVGMLNPNAFGLFYPAQKHLD